MKKFVLWFLCFACLLGAVSCRRPGEEIHADPEEAYASVIEAYCALVQTKVADGTLTAPGDGAPALDTALYDLVNACEDPASLGYAFKDINGDGIFELSLMTRDSRIYGLLTLEKGEPSLVLLTRLSAAISDDGTVYSTEYDPERISCVRIQTLEGGQLVGLEYGTAPNEEGERSYYKEENGVRTEITWEEMQALDYGYHMVGANFAYTNRKTGFRFISALPADPSVTPPPRADFSSYEAILAAYKTIVEQFGDCTQQKWTDGEYDGLFTFTNNTDYEIFHDLFSKGYLNRPTTETFGWDYPHNGNNAYGYAQKDLNGDGTEELIIMDHDFRILNVFTMKEGRPVLLPEAGGCWIDENGYFHKQVSTGGQMYRDGEAYLYEIRNGEMHCSVGVGYQVNVYLKKEGWYKIEDGKHESVSAEEGEEMLERCTKLPERCVGNEYTRMNAGLTFTPLFERTTALRMHEDSYVNFSYQEASRLTVADVSEGKVTFSFDCVLFMSEFDPEHPEVEPEVVSTRLEGEAVLGEDGRYAFDTDGVRGYLEFTVTSVWVVITESEQENVPCRAYLLDDHEKRHP